MAKLNLNDTKWDFVFVAGDEQVATHCPTWESMIAMTELDKRLKSTLEASDQIALIPDIKASLKQFVSPSQQSVIDTLGVDDVLQVFLACGEYWMEHIKKKAAAAQNAVRTANETPPAKTPTSTPTQPSNCGN